MRFTVEPWAPEYDVPMAPGVSAGPPPEVDVGVERPAGDWSAIVPAVELPQKALFVDGVQRIDARIWSEREAGEAAAGGFCASFAVGAVRCAARAEVIRADVSRIFVSTATEEPILTRFGDYRPVSAASDAPDSLANGLREALRSAELELTRDLDPADLIIVDGPLRGRTEVEHAVGYLKTHHVTYLPSEQHALIGTLPPGTRTPLFNVHTTWGRYSWYARLPQIDRASAATSGPWAAIVRLEISAETPLGGAIALADQATALIGRFASSRYKDPRAPQNLYPIGGLERHLRRLLGDREVLYRAICGSAATELPDEA